MKYSSFFSVIEGEVGIDKIEGDSRKVSKVGREGKG
jgi:hypothetical protein